MYILREFCQHLINHVVYCIPHKQSTTLFNSVLQNKGGATSPISQLDTVWSQEDRHDPTWFLKPLKQTTFPQFKQSRAMNAAVFIAGILAFYCAFLQCRHHTIPTKWPQHSTPWWQLSKSLPTQLSLCQGKAIVGYVYFGHSIDWSLYFCIFIVFTVALLKCEVVLASFINRYRVGTCCKKTW